VATAYRKTAQKIKNAEVVVIKLDTVINDPGSNISTVKTCYVAPEEGYYSVAGEVLMAVGTVTTALFTSCSIRVGGVAKLSGNEAVTTVSAGTVGVTVAGIVLCKKGDEITLAVVQEDPALGAEKELTISEAANRLSVVRVA
jgi:hypothetical protein